MGGRGTRFAPRRPPAAPWSTSPRGDDVATTLRGAIGQKGAQKTIGEATREANPYFSENYREFSENCQRCVVAYELLRRGYNVEALPTFRGDTLPRVAYKDARNNTWSGYWKGAFQHAKTEDVSGRSIDAVLQNITNKMHGYGNGSRAVIQIFYTQGGGHVFNVENQGGRVTFIEAQAGHLKDSEIRDVLAATRLGTVNIVRTDNLRISDRAKNFVHQRRAPHGKRT